MCNVNFTQLTTDTNVLWHVGYSYLENIMFVFMVPDPLSQLELCATTEDVLSFMNFLHGPLGIVFVVV
jgi:hypothetical protein